MAKKTLILGLPAACMALLSCFTAGAHAADYYVSPNGDDSNNGSPASPFRTIARASLSLQPGDRCVLRGGVYRETVVPAKSGTVSDPIIYTNYPGEKPVVSGADVVTNWSPIGNAVHQATFVPKLKQDHTQVFVDGKPSAEARLPGWSHDFMKVRWRTISGGTVTPDGTGSVVTISDAALTEPDGYFNGAQIKVMVADRMQSQSGTVVSSKKGSLTFKTVNPLNTFMHTQPTVPGGSVYYLYRHSRLLDSANEWFYDSPNQKLQLRTPWSDDPNNRIVEVRQRNYAFNLAGRSFVEVRNIRIFAAGVWTDANTRNCTFDNVMASYVWHIEDVHLPTSQDSAISGIVLNGSNNSLINSAVEFSGVNGVTIKGFYHTVRNTIIHDINYGLADGTGIYMNGVGHVITDNTIYNAANTHISHRLTQGAKILRNDLYYGGRIGWDVGGIYAYKTDCGGTEIAYNKIHDSFAGGFGFDAIYMDNDTRNAWIHHNLTWNVDVALKLNTPSTGIIAHNNTLLSTKWGIDAWPNTDFTGDMVFNNIVHAPNRTTLPGAYVSHNIFSGVDPKFTNPEFLNFGLQAISPGLEAGVHIGPYTNGFLGQAPEIGAYEAGSFWDAGASNPNVPPAAPYNIQTKAGDGQITISWAPVKGAVSYNVYRGETSGGPYIRVATWTPATSFVDTTVVNGKPYYYLVNANNHSGMSGNPIEVSGSAWVAGTGTGLTGRYYNDVNTLDRPFTNLVLTRIDPQLDYDWGDGSPAPVVKPDVFSARWTGEVQAPVTGTYTFWTDSADGILLWINDELKVNFWGGARGVNTFTMDMVAGQKYRIRIDYQERYLTAWMKLYWQFPGQDKQIIPKARLYPGS